MDGTQSSILTSPLTYWTLRFCIGIAVLIGSGMGLPSAGAAALSPKGNFLLLDVFVGLAGFWIALAAVEPLVRSLGSGIRLRRQWGPHHAAFAAATTPQRVFLLLLAVAEADRPAGPKERELVREFLRRRFDALARAELDAWATAMPRLPDLEALARRIARDLDQGECATLYSWCCLVANADGELDERETRALHQVASGLGLEPHHAAFLFAFAQQSARMGTDGRANGRSASSAGAGTGARKTAVRSAPSSPRERALHTLGLPADATPDSIRRRHRELVRRFHPDAQPRLGSAAQKEASERFLAIQRAYEVLTG
jgi:uncharacterized tellurite resistance protein B-like protein